MSEKKDKLVTVSLYASIDHTFIWDIILAHLARD